MDRSTISFLFLALAVGFGLQFLRSKVFGDEVGGVVVTNNVEKITRESATMIDPELEAAMSAIVETDQDTRAIVSSGGNSSAEQSQDLYRDIELMRGQLDEARSLRDRREIMAGFIQGSLSDRSTEALEKNIEFLREEIEFISGKYMHEYDSSEFNSYFIDLMKYAYDHQYELNSRDSQPTLVVDKLLDGNMHQEIREKIIQYINVGTEDKLD